MRAETRLWRTADGRLVADGDPAGVTLAYAAGDDITAGDRDKVPGKQKTDEPKAADQSANKARRPAGNK